MQLVHLPSSQSSSNVNWCCKHCQLESLPSLSILIMCNHVGDDSVALSIATPPPPPITSPHPQTPTHHPRAISCDLDPRQYHVGDNIALNKLEFVLWSNNWHSAKISHLRLGKLEISRIYQSFYSEPLRLQSVPTVLFGFSGIHAVTLPHRELSYPDAVAVINAFNLLVHRLCPFVTAQYAMYISLDVRCLYIYWFLTSSQRRKRINFNA